MTWNIIRNTDKMKNEKGTLQGLDFGQKTEKCVK